LPVKYVEGVLVVQSQGAKNLETSVHDLREERINFLYILVKILFDTSVLVAAMLADHPRHFT
jgi:hypothetical protein